MTGVSTEEMYDPEAEGGPASTLAAPVRGKILVIDDAEIDRELSTLMLERQGYQVVALSSATRCIETIAAESPDLVLLDVMMPDMNGNEAVTLIRKKYSLLELPVIMATAKTDASDVVASLRAGASDYITKPVNFDVAFRRIRNHLKLAGQARAMGQLRELSAIHSMIVTYNHEINNPLTIALGFLEVLEQQHGPSTELRELETALWRIGDIVKKTRNVLNKGTHEYDKYAETATMLSLHDDVR